MTPRPRFSIVDLLVTVGFAALALTAMRNEEFENLAIVCYLIVFAVLTSLFCLSRDFRTPAVMAANLIGWLAFLPIALQLGYRDPYDSSRSVLARRVYVVVCSGFSGAAIGAYLAARLTPRRDERGEAKR